MSNPAVLSEGNYQAAVERLQEAYDALLAAKSVVPYHDKSHVRHHMRGLIVLAEGLRAQACSRCAGGTTYTVATCAHVGTPRWVIDTRGYIL